MNSEAFEKINFFSFTFHGNDLEYNKIIYSRKKSDLLKLYNRHTVNEVDEKQFYTCKVTV